MSKIVSDIDFALSHDVDFVQTKLHGNCDVTVPVKDYVEDAGYPTMYQAYWHSASLEISNDC